MTMCEHCDETPGKAAAMLREFVEKWPNSPWGPFHIVIDDYNLGDYHINWCIQLTEAFLGGEDEFDGLDPGYFAEVRKNHSEEELVASIALARELLKIPEDER